MTDSAKTLFDNAMDFWFLLEIEHGRISGQIAGAYELRGAQAVFYSDGRPPEICLNEEVQIAANVKLGETISLEAERAMVKAKWKPAEVFEGKIRAKLGEIWGEGARTT